MIKIFSEREMETSSLGKRKKRLVEKSSIIILIVTEVFSLKLQTNLQLRN